MTAYNELKKLVTGEQFPWFWVADAFLAALGIATALSLHESTEIVLKWGGTLILVWLEIGRASCRERV